MKRWYEIDGFITKAQDRHEMIRSFKVGDLKPLLSDHKPVEIKLKVASIKPKIIKLIKMKQKNKQPNIKWERLMDDECANQFREKTSERVEKCLCEKIGVMYGLLKHLQRRGDYNNAKNLLLCSEETFKEHLEKQQKNALKETQEECNS